MPKINELLRLWHIDFYQNFNFDAKNCKNPTIFDYKNTEKSRFFGAKIQIIW